MFTIQNQMHMLDTAVKFILDLVLQNEEVKKFPGDFLTASMKWMRSWFLTDDDPATAAVINSPQTSPEEKQEAVRKKTETLLENPEFRRELEGYLKRYDEIRVENSQNVLIGNTIHAQTVIVGNTYNNPGAAAPPAGSLTAMERQAAEQRLGLLIQKRQAVQKGRDLEADAGRQFAYEQQLADLDKDIAQLKNQLGYE